MDEEQKLSEATANLDVDDEDEDNPNYKVPKQKKMEEMLDQDKDDESLQKYKQTLLGTTEQKQIGKYMNRD